MVARFGDSLCGFKSHSLRHDHISTSNVLAHEQVPVGAFVIHNDVVVASEITRVNFAMIRQRTQKFWHYVTQQIYSDAGALMVIYIRAVKNRK